jgi:hypothetical protein
MALAVIQNLVLRFDQNFIVFLINLPSSVKYRPNINLFLTQVA